MPDMPGFIAKSTIFEKIDAYINESPAARGATARQALTDSTLNDLLKVAEELGIELEPHEEQHLQQHWFDAASGWWQSSQPVEPIVRRGLLEAVKLVAEKGVPIDCYWACASGEGHFETWVLESDAQVTLVVATPPTGVELPDDAKFKGEDPILASRRGSPRVGEHPDGEGHDPQTGIVTVRPHKELVREP